jgi:hypothetical protein
MFGLQSTRTLMPAPELGPQHATLAGRADLECVEVYVPKKLEHLSALYRYLNDKVTAPDRADAAGIPIDGFSVYEVDGAFRGQTVYQERTLVVRILFVRPADESRDAIHQRILNLAREVAQAVALAEEELWICHYPQGIVIVHPTAARPAE